MKNNYISLVLAACLSIASTTLSAQVTPAPEPANITTPATSPAEHKEAAALHKSTTKAWPSIINR